MCSHLAHVISAVTLHIQGLHSLHVMKYYTCKIAMEGGGGGGGGGTRHPHAVVKN